MKDGYDFGKVMFLFRCDFHSCRCKMANCQHFHPLFCDKTVEDVEGRWALEMRMAISQAWDAMTDGVAQSYTGRLPKGSYKLLPGEKKERGESFCKCGCGQVVPRGRKFVHGHNTRIANPNPFAQRRLVPVG